MDAAQVTCAWPPCTATFTAAFHGRSKRYCGEVCRHRASQAAYWARRKTSLRRCTGCGAPIHRSRSKCVYWCGDFSLVEDHPGFSTPVPEDHPGRRDRCGYCARDFLAVRRVTYRSGGPEAAYVIRALYCDPECMTAATGLRRRNRARAAYVAPVSMRDLMIRDVGLCGICGSAITEGGSKGGGLSLDHIIPLARGGTHEPANAQPAHHGCNQLKSDHITLADVRRRLQVEQFYVDQSAVRSW